MLSTTEPALRHLFWHLDLELSFLQLLGCSLRALVPFLGRDASKGSFPWAAYCPCHLFPFNTCPASAQRNTATNYIWVFSLAVLQSLPLRWGSAQTFLVSLLAPCLTPHGLLCGILLSPLLLLFGAPQSLVLGSVPLHFTPATLLCVSPPFCAESPAVLDTDARSLISTP